MAGLHSAPYDSMMIHIFSDLYKCVPALLIVENIFASESIDETRRASYSDVFLEIGVYRARYNSAYFLKPSHAHW
jgi:hypothetical protein